jgi:hypothetical protein
LPLPVKLFLLESSYALSSVDTPNMTSPCFFSSPFNSAAHREYVQTTFYERSKKRKRENTSDTSDEDEPTVHAEHGATASTSDRRPSTTAEEVARGKQFEEDDRDDFDSDFPHTSFVSQRIPSRSLPPSKLTRELANLNPPLHRASGGNPKDSPESQQSGLKQQHLAVLTTIMHKSLMQGNYMRAGRAWGLLLRAEIKGRPMDLRSNGLWGLGAEILLQSDVRVKNGQNNHIDYTREGFDNAKAYYHRLILQYPWRKWHPDALSSLHFYPAMFALWVSFVYDGHREALEELPRGSLTPSKDEVNSEDFEVEPANAKRQAIRDSTLRSAEEIAGRLDDILMSFPYSDSASLWSLGGMIARWMSDLCLPHSKKYMQDHFTAGGEDNAQLASQNATSIEDERALRARLSGIVDEGRLERSSQYLEKSTRAFAAARRLRDGLADGFEDPPLDDNRMPLD